VNGSIETLATICKTAVSTTTVGGTGNAPVATMCITMQIGQFRSSGSFGTFRSEPADAVLIEVWACNEGWSGLRSPA
jgi:hypothetical protein